MKWSSRLLLIFLTGLVTNQKAFATDGMQRPRVMVTTDG